MINLLSALYRSSPTWISIYSVVRRHAGDLQTDFSLDKSAVLLSRIYKV